MAAILEMRNICKKFPGVPANDNICLRVEAGEVHTLLGENGAGKSTLMNILCGLYKPTSGEIFIDGKQVHFSSAKDAMEIGVGMVHQHFMLIPTLTVTENCLIGAKSSSAFKLDTRSAGLKIGALAREHNMNIDPDAKVSELSVGARQRVEIIKALFRGARILILDEPTSVLTPQEASELFKMIRSLKERGFTVLFISHKLNEVMECSDRVTVLRLGKLIGTYDIADCSVERLAYLMVGRDVSFSVNSSRTAAGKTVLSVKGLRMEREKGSELRHLSDVAFDVHAGEIFGVAGVDGNGQSQLVESLTGLVKVSGGTAMFEGRDILRCSTREIMRSGVSHIPQDRQKSGLIMQMSLTENFILQDYYDSSFSRRGFVNWETAACYSEKLIKDYNIKTPGRFELTQNLSGGNQQKVVVARELSRGPKLLIAMHPTRGLDVGAIEYIHRKINSQRDDGTAVLLVSTELEEVMKLSNRICVMYEGRIMGIVTPSDTTIEEMGLMMGGKRLAEIR